MSGALQNNLETQFKEVRVALTVKHAYLKTPHVSRVPCILQAVLVTLKEELQEEPVHVTERNK